jgi:Glycosyl transferase family 2
MSFIDSRFSPSQGSGGASVLLIKMAVISSRHCLQVLIACFGFFTILTLYLSSGDDEITEVKPMKIIQNLVALTKDKLEDENNLLDVYVVPLSVEILEFHQRLNLTNPGHLGEPVELGKDLPEDIQGEIDQSNSEFKFNEFVSRLIPLDRELRDMRQGTCRNATYLSDLPKASIILAFYNEPFSMIMRTIYSVLKRSPPELIEEIILVDDCSDKGL